MLVFNNLETDTEITIDPMGIVFIGRAPKDKGGIIVGVHGGSTFWIDADYRQAVKTWIEEREREMQDDEPDGVGIDLRG
jgi:hypothetical protein